MELLHALRVAELVAPPPADEVEAGLVCHGGEEVGAPVGGPGELGGFFGGEEGGMRAVLGDGLSGEGKTTEVGGAFKDEAFVSE